jgi:hypothetical protein
MGLLFATLLEESHWQAARDYPKWKCDSVLELRVGLEDNKKLWFIIAGSTKVRPTFFFLLLPIFLSKMCLDSGGVQKHFGIAHYTLWVLLCTFWACNANPKCAPQDPYCVVGSTKMYLGISHLF